MATRKKKTASRKPAATRRATPGKAAKKTTAARRAKRAAAAAKPAAKKTAAGAKRAAAKKKTSATTAARKPARRAPSSGRAVPMSAPDASVFPCGDDAVRRATGRGWDEWLHLLDAAGASALGHQRIWEIAMRALPGTDGWWGQMVSVGYERARGLREKHETSAGDYQATISRTLPVPLFAAFAAWAEENLRQSWLAAPGLDFTKLNPGRNIRARWPDGTLLDIRFNASGPDKCQIVVDTMKLADAGAVQRAKAFWQDQIERLRTYLRV